MGLYSKVGEVMKRALRGFAISALLLIAARDLSAMCIATPCYLLKVSVASSGFPEGSVSCLLDGTLLSSKQVECSGVASYRGYNPSELSSESGVPGSIKFPLQLNEDRALCESLHKERDNILLYVFQDCCDTPGRNCLRGYQAKMVPSRM